MVLTLDCKNFWENAELSPSKNYESVNSTFHLIFVTTPQTKSEQKFHALTLINA